MKCYRCPCGLYFKTSGCGSMHHKGESWGDVYGKETTYCPLDKQETCEYGIAFHEKYPLLHRFNTCEGVEIPETEYDYENSAEKIKDEYDKESYRKIKCKFGDVGMCGAIRADGRGGYEINRDEIVCADCWNDVCVVTKQKRDTTKVRIMAEIEREWTDVLGMIKEEHKTVTIKRVKDEIPMEVAERCLKMKDCVYTAMFETNNLTSFAQQMGWEPQAKIRRYYIEPCKAKRDLLQDLSLIAEGFTVEHESDLIKAKKEKKREARKERQEAKERRIKKKVAESKKPKMVQTNLFDE